MEKVYLVLARHVVKETKQCKVWSEWYTFSCDECYKTFDDALNRVIELRCIAESKGSFFVDYRVQTLFLQ